MSVVHQRRIAYSQHFLRSPRLVDDLLARSGIAPDDLVIEIGPGRGVITERLAVRCRQVLAVEKDPHLVAALRERFAGADNVALFAADFLSFPLPLTSYKVFANIPFNITAAIVGKLTSGIAPPVDAYLGVQREAAERFLGMPRETVVALLRKSWFDAAVVHHFQPRDFVPAPGVAVVLLHLHRREAPLLAASEAALYGDLVSYAFSAWQPTVDGALRQALPARAVAAIARQAGVDLDRPPSGVPFADWLRLTAAWRAVAGARVTAVRGARQRLERQQAGLEKVHRTRPGRKAAVGDRKGRPGA